MNVDVDVNGHQVRKDENGINISVDASYEEESVASAYSKSKENSSNDVILDMNFEEDLIKPPKEGTPLNDTGTTHSSTNDVDIELGTEEIDILDSVFFTTLRHMQYRGFQRWYRGYREKRSSAGFWCVAFLLFVFVFDLLVHIVYCNAGTSTKVYVMYICLCLIAMILSSFTYLTSLKKLIMMICIVYLFMCIIILLLSENIRHLDNYLCQNRANFFSIYSLIFIVLLYFVIALDFSHRFLLGRFGSYYYNNSIVFLKKWEIVNASVISMLAPRARGIRMRYLARRVIPSNTIIDFLGIRAKEKEQHNKVLQRIAKEAEESGIQANYLRNTVRITTGVSVTFSMKLSIIERIINCFLRQKPKSVRYRGELNKDGIPNGFGMWEGINDPYGERLVGFFSDGVPVAPFKANENATGSGFVSCKIGLTLQRGPNSPLEFGIANVECSISGAFYRDYPNCHIYWRDEEEKPNFIRRIKTRFLSMKSKSLKKHILEGSSVSQQSSNNNDEENVKFSREYFELVITSIKWMLDGCEPHNPEFGLTDKKELLVGVNENSGVYVSGYLPKEMIVETSPIAGSYGNLRKRMTTTAPCKKIVITSKIQSVGSSIINNWKSFNNKPQLELHVKDWLPLTDTGVREILLFIHGFNNNEVEAIKTIGQFAAFGFFPSYITLMVYSWASGRGLGYNEGRTNAESVEAHAHLFHLFKALSANGVSTIHIMCHSMGSRLFLHTFRRYYSSK